MTDEEKLPTVDVLREKFAHLLRNEGLRRVRNWALPNAADPTNEEEIYELIQKDDTGRFLRISKNVMRSLDKQE